MTRAVSGLSGDASQSAKPRRRQLDCSVRRAAWETYSLSPGNGEHAGRASAALRIRAAAMQEIGWRAAPRPPSVMARAVGIRISAAVCSSSAILATSSFVLLALGVRHSGDDVLCPVMVSVFSICWHSASGLRSLVRRRLPRQLHVLGKALDLSHRRAAALGLFQLALRLLEGLLQLRCGSPPLLPCAPPVSSA